MKAKSSVEFPSRPCSWQRVGDMDITHPIPVPDGNARSSQDMEHLDLIRTVRIQQAEVAQALAARMVADGILPAGPYPWRFQDTWSDTFRDSVVNELAAIVFPILVDHIQAVIRCVCDGEPIPESPDETTAFVREFFLRHWGPVQPLGQVENGRLDLDFESIARWRKYFP